MPILSVKPRKSLRTLTEIRGLSNKAEHIGRSVRLTRLAYLGSTGKIIGAVTAEDRNEAPMYRGARGVFYTIELADRILEGVTWWEFLRA